MNGAVAADGDAEKEAHTGDQLQQEGEGNKTTGSGCRGVQSLAALGAVAGASGAKSGQRGGVVPDAGSPAGKAVGKAKQGGV